MDREIARNCLTVLTRLAARRPAEESTLRAVFDSGDLVVLMRLAMEVAVQTGDPMGRILAEELHTRATSATPSLTSAQVRELLAEVPFRTTELREAGMMLCRLALAAESVAQPDGGDDDSQAGRARLMRDLSHRLSDLGDDSEALEAIDRSIEVFRALRIKHPSFALELGLALQDRGTVLHLLGRTDDALDSLRTAVST